MSILIFIIGIIVLIVVHEFGHFIVAKLSKMRVDEFGLGYPPRAAIIGRIGETILSLNWLPFGGFVKIYGEDIGAVPARSKTCGPSPARLHCYFYFSLVPMLCVYRQSKFTPAHSPREATPLLRVPLPPQNPAPAPPAR